MTSLFPRLAQARKPGYRYSDTEWRSKNCWFRAFGRASDIARWGTGWYAASMRGSRGPMTV